MSVPPPPAHVLRGHSAQLNALSFSADNKRLYSGDAHGQVIVTSTQTLRPFASWRPHTEGILGIEEWGEDSVITHGRDNKLHVWTRVTEPTSLAETAATPTLPEPLLKFSMSVNALNYCRFSLLPVLVNVSRPHGLLALPNLIESSLADIWAIPARERLHAAIGKMGMSTLGLGDGRGGNKTGIIMSLHLFKTSHASASSQMQLRLLVAYENGSVSLMANTSAAARTVEGKGWENLWTAKAHVESVMAMAVKMDNTAAFTVSADNLLCRYDEVGCSSPNHRMKDQEFHPIVHRTKHAGNGAIAVRNDGRVITVGGWDGKLYSTKTFKTLGTLSYHKESCNALAFANTKNYTPMDGVADEIDEAEPEGRENWLATGGKDHRVAIWKLISFNKR